MLTTVTSTAMKNCSMDIAHSTSHTRTGTGLSPRVEEEMPESIDCSVALKSFEQHKGPLRMDHEATGRSRR